MKKDYEYLEANQSTLQTEVMLYNQWQALNNKCIELCIEGNEHQTDDLYPAMWLIEDAFERKGYDIMMLFY